jgi:hypothetical protein
MRAAQAAPSSCAMRRGRSRPGAAALADSIGADDAAADGTIDRLTVGADPVPQ